MDWLWAFSWGQLSQILFSVFMSSVDSTTGPSHFKPILYRRYVDDTFVVFKEKSHADQFRENVSNQHNKISFTMETETDDKLPFLDLATEKMENFSF